MKEHPILFSGSMVRQILNDQKWVTRRLHPPRWKVGDVLWVRENWYVAREFDNMPPRDIQGYALGFVGGEHLSVRRGYLADCQMADWAAFKPPWAGKTRPAIFMPRWLCRVTLKVVAVGGREPLHNITDEGAWAEGVSDRIVFGDLWKEINGAASWAKNPDVWPTTFDRIK
jgi:hypothetical protein